MKIDNIECQIICDGEVLVEYQEKDDDQRAKSCHIISGTGKHFTVRSQCSSHDSKLCFSFHLWVDGKRLRKTHMNKVRVVETRGVHLDSSTIRPFQFSSIVLTDDDRALQETNVNVNDLGTICVNCYRVKDVRTKDSYLIHSYDSDNRPVHERSKKAGGHRVTLGEAVMSQPTYKSSCTYIDSLDSPYCSFTWRYRPKDILQAQGIVPLDTVPVPPKRPGSSTDCGPSKPFKRLRTEQSPPQQGSGSQVKLEDTPTARELQARRDVLRAQRSAIDAQEAIIEEELRRVKGENIKREASPITLRGASSGDIIDLTDDD